MTRSKLAHGAFLLLIVALYVFLIAPIVIVVLASLNSGRFLVFPPEGFSLQWYVKFVNSRAFMRSFMFSLKLAALTTVIASVIGTAAALYVVRRARQSTTLRLLLAEVATTAAALSAPAATLRRI